MWALSNPPHLEKGANKTGGQNCRHDANTTTSHLYYPLAAARLCSGVTAEHGLPRNHTLCTPSQSYVHVASQKGTHVVQKRATFTPPHARPSWLAMTKHDEQKEDRLALPIDVLKEHMHLGMHSERLQGVPHSRVHAASHRVRGNLATAGRHVVAHQLPAHRVRLSRAS